MDGQGVAQTGEKAKAIEALLAGSRQLGAKRKLYHTLDLSMLFFEKG